MMTIGGRVSGLCCFIQWFALESFVVITYYQSAPKTRLLLLHRKKGDNVMIMLLKLLNLAFIAITCNASTPMSSPFRQSLLTPIVVGVRRATRNTQRRGISSTAITANSHDVVRRSRGGAAKTNCDGKPPVKLLRWAYAAAGLATTAGWGTMVYTSIRDNQPVGAMMPCEFGI